MGILRTLLSISVVFAHTYGFVFVGSVNAVRIFYMISGFLISYVLTESQTYTDIKPFYINRYLRLYPLYAVVCFGALIWNLAVNNSAFLGTFKDLSLTGYGLLVFSNIFILFQDATLFLKVHDGELHFLPHSGSPLYLGLLIPQAWSIALELSFYIIAPFLWVSVFCG